MKEFEPFMYIEKDDEEYDEFHVLYAGEGLSSKYPDDYNFWLYLPKYNMWERHSIDKRAELIKPDKDELRYILRMIFLANKWVVSS